MANGAKYLRKSVQNMNNKQNMGIREFLFLWSECVQRKWNFHELLEIARYSPSADIISLTEGDNAGRLLKVSREGAASCAILNKHGISQKEIDVVVRICFEHLSEADLKEMEKRLIGLATNGAIFPIPKM